MRHAVIKAEGLKQEEVEMRRGRKVAVCCSKEVTHMHLPVVAEHDKSVRTLGRCTGLLHHSGTALWSVQLWQVLEASHFIASNLIRGISGHDVRNHTHSSFQGHYPNIAMAELFWSYTQ